MLSKKTYTIISFLIIFLSNIVNISINIVILSINKIQIDLQLISKANQTSKEFQFVWDNAKKEVIINKQI